MLEMDVVPETGVRSDAGELRRRLRAATEPDHRRLEDALALQDAALPLQRYCRVLAAFHGFYAPLEARLRSFGPVAPPLGFELPDRARLLALDLAALGAAPRAEPCADLPEIATTAELAGCLYVLEGAALGGQVLARSAAERWALTPRNGAAFFYGAGPRGTKRRWALVLAWLERVGESGAHAPAIAAARATFAALERWAAATAATATTAATR